MHIKIRCIKYTETNNKIKVALINLQWFRVLGASFSSFECFVFDLGVFVFEFWVLRFRVLSASFSIFGCFVFEIWVLRASVFVFECFVFETTICLQYLLYLSLIFRLCWLWGNWELVWDIIRGKFAKQVLSVFFLPNEVISYVYKVRASVLSLWTCNIMRWFSLESPLVERKYVFTRFKAENHIFH